MKKLDHRKTESIGLVGRILKDIEEELGNDESPLVDLNSGYAVLLQQAIEYYEKKAQPFPELVCILYKRLSGVVQT